MVNFQLSYCIPVVILMVRGRSLLDEAAMARGRPRRFNLGRFGYAVNAFAIAFNVFTAVFFFFPPELPVDAASMNYVAAVEGVIIIVAALTWALQGRKTFEGPLDIEYIRGSDVPSQLQTASQDAPTELRAEKKELETEANKARVEVYNAT